MNNLRIRTNEPECFYPYELWRGSDKLADLTDEDMDRLIEIIDEARFGDQVFHLVHVPAEKVGDAILSAGRNALSREIRRIQPCGDHVVIGDQEYDL